MNLQRQSGFTLVELPVTGKYEQAWVYSLAKYLEDVEAIRICPSDLAGELRVRGKGTSYALNGWLSREARPPFDSRRKIASTSKTVVAFELSEERDAGAMRSGDPADVDIFYDHVHSFNWFKTSHITAGTVLAAIRSDVAIERHQGASHFLYADGHVDLVSSEQVGEWATLPFDFSRPEGR